MFFNEEASGYPLANIISEYKFQNNTLDTVGSNDGTPTALTYTAGLVGQTGVFNGSTGKVVIADNNNLSFILVPFSVTFLVNFTSTARAFLISKRKTSSSNVEYQITYNSGEFTFAIFGGGTNASFMATRHTLTPTLGQWYHIVGTYDGSGDHTGINLYFNGLNVGTSLLVGTYISMENGLSAISVGKFFDGTANTLNGSMDCVRIWNKELSQAEVTEIYNLHNSGLPLI